MRFFTFWLSIWSLSGASEATGWMTRPRKVCPRVQQRRNVSVECNSSRGSFTTGGPRRQVGRPAAFIGVNCRADPWGTWGHLGVAWKLLDISSMFAF